MKQTSFPFDSDSSPQPSVNEKQQKKKGSKRPGGGKHVLVDGPSPLPCSGPAKEPQPAHLPEPDTHRPGGDLQAGARDLATPGASPGRPAAPADLTLDQFLCFSLYSAGHAMNRIYKPILKELGLTYPQFLAMMVLWKKDRILVGTLCERLHLESNTVTPLLKRLEAEGLLTRTRDKKDERQVRIALTRQGRALQRKTANIATCVLAATGMHFEEVLDLQSRIMTLRDNLLKADAK